MRSPHLFCLVPCVSRDRYLTAIELCPLVRSVLLLAHQIAAISDALLCLDPLLLSVKRAIVSLARVLFSRLLLLLLLLLLSAPCSHALLRLCNVCLCIDVRTAAPSTLSIMGIRRTRSAQQLTVFVHALYSPADGGCERRITRAGIA